ncbi:MAG TPA: NADH-quinone oxidoreductase subunit N [Armatimonadota bacterium]|jgi:NADH-quinone oxidoreductase subunit N
MSNPVVSGWTPANIDVNWLLATPITILVLAGLVAMMVDAFSKKKAYVAGVALAGIAASMFACFRLWDTPAALAMSFGLKGDAATSQLTADNYALLLSLIILAAGALTVIMSLDYLKGQRLMRGEYFILLLFAMSAMILMVQATELITIFLALEAFSVSLYVLSAFARKRKRSAEAGLKYLLLGAFSSAFLLYGIALIYGTLGTTNLLEINRALASASTVGGDLSRYLLPAGIGMLLVGLGFKVAAVPFHLWTPDVYEGAPTPITAFMSVATKAAAFGVMGRVLLFAFPSARPEWEPIVVAMAIATMVVGNVVAITQNNVKRLLAYSSIAHAGYLLIAIVANDSVSLLYYLMGYAVMNIGAFAVVAHLAHDGREFSDISDFRGLAHRNPLVAVAMTIFMFSLAGIPFSIGFNAKFVLFLNAVGREYTGLVILAVLASAVSAFYYLRVVVAMWMREHDGQTAQAPARMAPGIGAVVTLCAILALLGGVVMNPLVGLASHANPSQAPGVAELPGSVARR